MAAGLRRRGIDVTTTSEAGLISASDEDQFEYARRTGRVFVTFDRGFLSIAKSQQDHPGVAYQFAGAAGIGELIRKLELIWEVLDAAEIAGRVEFL
ncbi:MAG: DUF5615 family PIN-like protein [Pirellulales bacterium]